MELFERAQVWIDQDPDASSREELRAILEGARSGDAEKLRDLTDRFLGPLEFGTAGLRGVLGAGETRMNRAVVRRTTLGLARYVVENVPGAKEKGIVIGYDGRRMSRAFAEDAACVLAEAGVVAHLTKDVSPTPVTAFITERLGAAAGVMVTASHNPPEYNGYKVYWTNAAQIIPPHDKGIAAAIAACPSAKDVPMRSFDEAKKSGLVHDVPDEVEAAYLNEVLALSVTTEGARDAAIVYTALHGVGDKLVRIVLDRAGFANVHSVAEQAEPNGEFPTVRFPNPEEKGALDLSYALAERHGADIVIANDPDVDRLAIAIRATDGKRFVQLTGNQVGVLLGHYLLTSGKDSNAPNRLVLASCVSSPQLGGIAQALGVAYEETLTGFKWIANRAMELEKERGLHFVFGYEEALGYTVGPLVRDKDGISAALLFAELWAKRRAEGKTMFDELEAIARKFGAYVSGQINLTMKGKDGQGEIAAIMNKLRGAPPKKVGERAVVAFTDVKSGLRKTSDGETKSALPPSDVLFFDLEGGHRIIARPSGTEPKIKFYFDVRGTMAASESMADAEARLNVELEALKTAFSELAKT